MDTIETYLIKISKDSIKNERWWLNTIGVIQGLSYGLCAIPDKQTLYDCEEFKDFAIIPVCCTTNRFDELKRILKELYGNICTFHKEEAQA